MSSGADAAKSSSFHRAREAANRTLSTQYLWRTSRSRPEFGLNLHIIYALMARLTPTGYKMDAITNGG